MLSIGVLQSSAQAGIYYAQDDYYTKDLASGDNVGCPSRWDGEGARLLGLEGEIDRPRFEALLNGELPNGELPNGVVLKRGQQGKHQPGWDLTFSAPKSVSLIALVGGDERVAMAHDEAVSEALRYLEATTAQARVKRGGKSAIETTANWVIARFTHDTSRELDPQLHTHAVVINATRRDDGGWRTLSSREMFRAKMTGGAIYRAELASALQRLGYQIEVMHSDGRFEVKGFSEMQLRHFSRRREEIEAALKDMGASGAKASATLALYTRARKGPIDRDELNKDWKVRADAQGLRFERPKPEKVPRPHRQLVKLAREAVDWAIAHLTERESVINHRDVIRHSLEYGTGHVTLSSVASTIAELGKERTLIPIRQARYTTTKVLSTERETIATVLRWQGRVRPIAPAKEAQSVARKHGLAKDQTAAATLILTTKDRIVGVQGYAGTGKTHMLCAVRECAERAGLVVRGFAPSATAARVLQDGAGIPSETLSRHLIDVTKESRLWQSDNELWVVDESSMMSSAQARQLTTAADRQRARLILVGDRQQLPPVEAGRPFAMLLEHGMRFAAMRELKRQKDPVLKAAVLDSIAHREAAALRRLSGHTTVIADRDERLQAVVNDYLARPKEQREQTLIVTGVNEDRREINERIRSMLRSEQSLVGPEVQASVLVQRDLTRPELARADRYQIGDIVRFGRSYGRYGISSGAHLSVIGIRAAEGLVELQGDRESFVWEPRRASHVEVYRKEDRTIMVGDRLRWTRNDADRDRRNGEMVSVRYVYPANRMVTVVGSAGPSSLDISCEGHWEHAYASTVHASQGKTVDRVLVHFDTRHDKTVGRESFYVAISRARIEARLYANERASLAKAVERPQGKEYAVRVLAQ